MAENENVTGLSHDFKDQAVTEYLDQLCAQLGRLPEARQVELRRELGGHLHQVLEDGAHSLATSEAVLLGRLVQEFGDPTTIGQQLACSHRPTRPAAPARSVLWLAFGIYILNASMFSYIDCELLRMEPWASGYGLLAMVLAGPAIPFVYGLLWGLRGGERKRDLRALTGLVLTCLFATAPFPPSAGFAATHWHLALILLWTLVALGGYGMVRAASVIAEPPVVAREEEKVKG